MARSARRSANRSVPHPVVRQLGQEPFPEHRRIDGDGMPGRCELVQIGANHLVRDGAPEVVRWRPKATHPTSHDLCLQRCCGLDAAEGLEKSDETEVLGRLGNHLQAERNGSRRPIDWRRVKKGR